jgi:LacI family transcriptional regulator
VVIVDDVVCTTAGCPHRGVKGAGNVALRRIYGPDSIRFLWCRTCKTEFSERRGTPLFDLRLPKAKIVDVVKHLAEGVGVRKTARLTGVSRDSVGRIVKLVGNHAKAVHEELVRDLDVPEVQMDEMWAFVGKKRQASQ